MENNEKEILDTLVELTNDSIREVKEQNKMLDEVKSTPRQYKTWITENETRITHLNNCLGYLNKRLAEIDPNKPCEHYFAISYEMVSKRKRYYYYENCEFCGCEPLSTLRDLNN